jgi:hypothetical protein
VQVQPGAIGKIIDGLRARLDPWLDEPKRERAEASVTLLYRFESEIPPTSGLRLKVEINTREHFSVFGHAMLPLAVESRWFAGRARILGRTSSTSGLPRSFGPSISGAAGAISSTCGTP